MNRLRCSTAYLCVVLALILAGSLLLNHGARAAPATVAAVKPGDQTPRMHAYKANVYLLRGLLNVFSLGMDELAEQLRAAGFAATVTNHTQWRSVADEITMNYRAGRRGPIILVGHSLGADAIMSMAEYLGQMGVPVALAVPFDGMSPHTATANVARVLNFYKKESARITPGTGFHGELTNQYITDASVGHFNIDKSAALHSLVVRKIRAIASSSPADRQSSSRPVPPAPRASTNP